MAYAHKDLTKEECMGLYNELEKVYKKDDKGV